jgi:hypothetical protein
MAKIHEEIIIIKLSKLVKDSATDTTIVDNDVVVSLIGVTEELVGAGVVVEVERA